MTRYCQKLCVILAVVGHGLITYPAIADDDDAFTLKFLYTGEEWANATGGVKRGTTNINDLDVSLAFDAGKKWGWTGATLFVDGFYNNGRTGNALTGSVQQASSYDADGPEILRLYQAWYNQDFNGGETSAMAGLFDLNNEFDVLDSAGMFSNSGYNWNTVFDKSGRGTGPSTFPDTSLGVRLRQRFGDDQAWAFQLAVVDGVSDNPDRPRENTIDINQQNGALILGEGYYHPGVQTKVAVGYWYYTAQFNDLVAIDSNGNPRKDSGNGGVYTGLNQRVYTIDDKRSVDSFINVGAANGDINRINRSLDMGINITGPLASRNADQLGFAYNIAHNSDAYMQSQALSGIPAKTNEMDYEVTYRAPLNDWLTLQPDIQYIANPGTNPALRNDWIFGIHVEIGHGFNF